jgi:hypothetical protein
MPSAKEQAEINKQLGLTEQLVSKINEKFGDAGYLGNLKKIAADSGAIAESLNRQGQLTEKQVKTTKTIANYTLDLAKNYDDIIKGEKRAGDLSILRKQAVKEGNKELVKQIDALQKANRIAEAKGVAYRQGANAVDSIVDRVKQASGGFINLERSGKGLKDKMFDVARGRGGMGSILKSTKLLKIGLAGAVLAAASFALEVNKAQRDLGTSFQQTSKILATSKAVAAVNKANGMTQEDTLSIIKGIGSEFGSFSDATTAATLQASNLVANFGVGSETVGKLARNIQAVSGGTLESSLDSAEFFGNLARAADVPVGDVMNDVANNSELFAKFGKEGGRNIAEAAIQAKKLGLELSSVSAIAEGLLNFEDSITKELEAELLLGRDINLEKARELAFNNDIAGALAEVSKIVSPEEFQKLDAVRRQTLAAAAGLDVGAFARAISGGGGGGPSFQSLGDTSAASIRSGAATAHAGETIVRTSNFDMGETNELLRSMKSEIQRLGTS